VHGFPAVLTSFVGRFVAEERGAAMTPAAAAEYVLLLVTEKPEESAAAPDLLPLSARERELVTLVARGRTDAQIAGQLSISVRSVRSRLNRIRAKTGSQRRADLTRLALQADLVLARPHRPCQRVPAGRPDLSGGPAGVLRPWIILPGRGGRPPAGLPGGRASGHDVAGRRGRSAHPPASLPIHRKGGGFSPPRSTRARR